MTACIHSAIAPNMNRCINCGATWTGEAWEAAAEKKVSKVVDFNYAGFRILGCASRGPIIGAVCQFKYKGYEVSLSTYGGWNAQAIVVYLADKYAHESEKVEDALAWIDAQDAGRKMAEAAEARNKA